MVRSYSLASSVANDFAAKAYVASLGQGRNEELKKLGVNVTVLLPGVTDTPVLAKLGFDVENPSMKPMPVEQCVSEALEALEANRPTCLLGQMNQIMRAFLPSSVTRKMVGRMLKENVERLQILDNMATP